MQRDSFQSIWLQYSIICSKYYQKYTTKVPRHIAATCTTRRRETCSNGNRTNEMGGNQRHPSSPGIHHHLGCHLHDGRSSPDPTRCAGGIQPMPSPDNNLITIGGFWMSKCNYLSVGDEGRSPLKFFSLARGRTDGPRKRTHTYTTIITLMNECTLTLTVYATIGSK